MYSVSHIERTLVGLLSALQTTSISVWTALSQQGLCVVVVDKNLICNTITLFRGVQLFCVCRRKAPAGSAVDKP